MENKKYVGRVPFMKEIIKKNTLIYNNSYTFFSNYVGETIFFGTELGKLLQQGDIITISGDLGSGKTSLIKGIAQGIKSNDLVSSPSFSIINEYSSRCPIYHFDFYRLNKPEEIEELGYEEYFFNNGIVLIEWPEIIEKYLPAELMSIKIIIDHNNTNLRKIIFLPKGERYTQLMEDLKSFGYFRN